MSNLKTYLARGAALACLIGPSAALAQTAPAPLSSVVVTNGAADYQPTGASVLNILGDRAVIDTPFSVNVLDRALIDNQQARSPIDILKNDPSVLVINTGQVLADNFSVRGFSLNNLANYRQDGGFLVNLSNIPLENKERVEVLRGLSGFLYGFTAPGGIVNYVTKRPVDRTFMNATVGVASGGQFYGAFDINARFGKNDQFGVRLNNAIETGEGAVDGMHMHRMLGSVAANWRVTKTLSLDVDYDRQDRNAKGLQDALILGAAVTAVPKAPDASKLFGQEFESYDTKTDNLGLRLHWAPVENWSIDLQARRSDFRRAINGVIGTLTNLDGTFTGALSADDKQRFLADSAQAIVSGKLNTGPVRHELTAGWMWIEQEQYRGDMATATIAATNLYAAVQRPRPQIGTNLRGFRYQSLAQESHSWFASDTVSVGAFSAILGVRRQMYKQVSYSFAGATTALYDRSITTPSLAVIYKPVSFASIYASYTKGLEQGGTAPTTAANAGEVLPPLESKQVEIGAKAALPRGLTLTAAVFEIKKGLEFIDPTSRNLVQAGEQVHRGFEANLGGAIFRDVSLFGGYTHLDAEAKNTGVATTSGKRPVNVPKDVFTLYGEYRVSALPGLAVTGSVRHVSNFAYDATNTRFAPGYTVADLGGRYTTAIAGRPTTFRLTVNNVADKNYWAGAAATALYIGAPRTFRFSVSTGF